MHAYTDALETALARIVASEAKRSQERLDAFSARLEAIEARAEADRIRAAQSAQETMAATVARIEAQVAERLAAVKDGAPGVDGRDGADGINGEAGPAGRDGADGKDGADGVNGRDGVDGKDGADGVNGRDGVDGNDGERGADGADADAEAIARTVIDLVAPRVDALVEMVTEKMAEVRNGIDGRDGVDGKDGEPGPAGRDGVDGKLPVAKEYAEGVHYAGDVVIADGATWQARVDTGRPPPHGDWVCLAARGTDALGFVVRDTWTEDGAYSRHDIAFLNGAAWVALKDDPGECPGPGWKLFSARGKSGQRGEVGPRGMPGSAAPGPVSMDVDGEGLLRLAMGDGKVLEADLYPLLVKR